MSRTHDTGATLETALYLPVKRFLEKLGFTVKGEVGGCDLVALSDDDPPVVVIGELKLTFNLELILQAVDRAGAADDRIVEFGNKGRGCVRRPAGAHHLRIAAKLARVRQAEARPERNAINAIGCPEIRLLHWADDRWLH